VSNVSAAHLLGPGLALPTGDEKAEKFADSMYSRIRLSEKEILAVADMPPIENESLSLLLEVLCKLGKQTKESSNSSIAFLSSPSAIPACNLFLIILYH
jgi:hypothetical protein